MQRNLDGEAYASSAKCHHGTRMTREDALKLSILRCRDSDTLTSTRDNINTQTGLARTRGRHIFRRV